MKKAFILALTLTLSVSALAWGRLGHASIAKIAEDHLTKRTKRAISEIMQGEPISGYASYADEYRETLLFDVGFDPSKGGNRISKLPHLFEVDMNFEPFRGNNDNGRYVNNCINLIMQYSDNLKNWKMLDDSTRFTELVLLVHFVGDMHCPEHVRYNPEDMTIGKYNVLFNGKEIEYHKYWDSSLMESRFPWSFSDFAYLLDSWSSSEQSEVVKGDPYDWGKEIAELSYPVHQVREGDVITTDLFEEHLSLMKSQLRKAGYRLAHQLNKVFDPRYARKYK